MNNNQTSTIAAARRSVAVLFAVNYTFSNGTLSPIEYLESCLDERTLHDRDSFWIARYNDICDAFINALAVGHPCFKRK